MDGYYERVEIPNFIEKIKLSEHRRAKYYKSTDKIPKKYQTEGFGIGKHGYLINIETGEKIIKNTRTVGKPNVKIISGQYYWQGAHPHIRRKMKKEMSESFCPYLSGLPIVKEEQYPIGVRIDLYDSLDDGTHQDIDNFMFLYRKVIHDVLADVLGNCKKVIKDDSKEYIQDIPSRFYPIDDHEKRKLVVEIYSL
jgi:hypothetical protein